MDLRSLLFEDSAIALKNPNKSSIRVQLLVSLLVPLCALWMISAGVAFVLAVSFANEGYDHELLNSADSVAARVRSDGTKVLVDLPPAAQAILRHNDRDKFYYQILKIDGTRISGDAIIPGPINKLDSRQPILRHARLDGKEVRIARIRVDVPNYPDHTVLVQVAETLNSRHQLVQQIMLSILVPQMLLIALGAFAVWRGVTSSLAPLKDLEYALENRTQLDLTPVSELDTPYEVRSLVRAINSLLGRLSEDLESQKRFVANAAHQFRTPLAALKTYIYCAKKLPADKQMNEMLDKIDSGTERMSHLSNKLLALAKAEPPNRNEASERVDLNYIASEATASFVPQATKKNLELNFIGTDNPAIVIGDPNNLFELTANLIENAVLYSGAGGHVTISITNGNQICLAVRDDGPGIPPEERSLVFERFYRVLGANAPGSGLGLSIVKEIALAHNAKVSIDYANNVTGTSITVAFPLAKKPEI